MPGSALAGTSVLDLGQQLPTPFTTLLLAQLGAEVVKVEPPSGDAAREIDPRMFEIVNAGKRSLVLDLKQERDRERLLEVAAGCDVFVEGFRPGTAARLGCSYEEVRAVRPDVVYCSLSGFGASGPYRDVPGHDLNYLGVAGGADPRQQGRIGVPFIDMGSGTTAALAILAAIRARDASGEGVYLDVAMLDVAAFWSGVKLDPEEGGEPAYGVFAAADGGLLTIAVLEDKFWRNLCACLGWGDWVEDQRFGSHAKRQRRAAEIEARLVATIATRDRDEWVETFLAADVPAAPAHPPSQVGLDPQVRARGLMQAAPEGDRSGWRPVSPLPAAVRSEQLAAAPLLQSQ